MWFLRRFVFSNDGWDMNQIAVIIDYLITSITIVAVAVPEGLPLAVTISLAYSMMKMMKDQNLVRHLAACETMDGATQICSDKTGTLTQNRMTVTDGWIAGIAYDNKKSETSEALRNLPAGNILHLRQNISINSSANIIIKDGQEVLSGAPTEIALLNFLKKDLKINYTEDREKLSRDVVRQYPFSSALKRMTTIIASPRPIVYVKGASEIVLGNCSHYLNEQGQEVPIYDEKDRFLQKIDEWASRGLRTLSLAYRELQDMPEESSQEYYEHNLVLTAIVAISDPIRKEVPLAVVNCQQAGITVRMLTGDNAKTAADIAKQCGIITSDKDIVMEGPEFRKLPDLKIDILLKDLKVLARCSPDDKLKLVKRLRANGEVVAVTGDGTNDAPQLREADVGFAMGISGTEVAKDASDIILLDDNFTSIQKAVLWGRNVYDSIRKFVQFQLTVNVCAVIIAFIGALTTGKSPLKAVQLLWVNLIMDTFAALALATDNPSPSLLNRAPHGRNSPLISRRMWNFIVGSAIFQLIILFTLLYIPEIPWLGIGTDDDLRTTILFNTFVFLQLWNEINSRKLDNSFVFTGIFSNSIFITVMIITICVQYLLVQFGGEFSHTIPLNSTQWLFSGLIGIVSIPLAIILRSIPVPPEKVEKVIPPPEPLLEKTEISLTVQQQEETNTSPAPRPVSFAQVGKKVLMVQKFTTALKSHQPTTLETLRRSRFYKEKVVIT